MGTTKITLNEITDEWLEVKKVYVKYSTYVQPVTEPYYHDHTNASYEEIISKIEDFSKEYDNKTN